MPYALIELAVAAYALANRRLFGWASDGYVALWHGLGPQSMAFAVGRTHCSRPWCCCPPPC